jgi:hypothetical protein
MQSKVEDDMTDKVKLRVRLGTAEFEYEGDLRFTKEEVTALIEQVVDRARMPPELGAPDPMAGTNGASIRVPQNAVPVGPSTTTIAARLKATTANDLAIAATARLVMFQKKDQATRAEILAEMKGAKGFYNTNMSKNMSNTLTSLVKDGRLNEVGADVYTLSHDEHTSLGQILAQVR